MQIFLPILVKTLKEIFAVNFETFFDHNVLVLAEFQTISSYL
jgi:hypothetical protein